MYFSSGSENQTFPGFHFDPSNTSGKISAGFRGSIIFSLYMRAMLPMPEMNTSTV